MVGFVTQNMAEVPPEMAHNAIATENAPTGSFSEIAESSFNNGITPSILSYSNLLGQRIGNQLRDQPLPKLSPQDIEGKYGIKVDAPMEDYEAKYIADAQHNEKQYQMATQNASGLKTFGADSLAFLSDPINLGSMFIPIAGQARVGASLGLDAGTIAGRAATRAITFGTAGAVSQAPLSAIKYGLSQTQHTDYSIADAMRDTLFAGVTGAIAGPLFGGLKDAIMGNPKWADTVQRFQRMKYGDNRATAQVGLAQVAKENPIDIEPVTSPIEARPASIKAIVENGGNPLYHDTSSSGLEGILNSGKINTASGDHKEPTISASRDFANYSRFADSPYRLILDERDIPHKSEPVSMLGTGDRQEAEQIFRQPIDLKAVKSLSINISNPNLMDDFKSGRFAELLQKAKDKGIPVEFYNDRTKVFLNPEEYAQAQQTLGKAAQQFIASQHENGVMGLGKHELANTIDASQVEKELEDPHTEAEKMQAQADQLEASLREKSDTQAMQEHDAWKDKQSTLDKAYQALHECLMR